MKLIHREPLTSDVVFKAVFGSDTPESKAALIELLNLLLNKEQDPIIDLVYKNPFHLAEVINEKEIIMDIKVETLKGEQIDIEMQIDDLSVYINRSIYYLCKQATRGLEKGDRYDKMKPSIIISFIKNKLFPHRQPMASVFTLRENIDSEQLSNILQLHYIELGKIDLSDRNPDILNPLEQIGAYFRCSGDQNEREFVEALIQKGPKVIAMTDNVLQKVSEEERLQYVRESRELAKLEQSWALQDAAEKGYSKGHAEGHAKGHAEGLTAGELSKSVEIARKLKSNNMTPSQISEITGLSIEQINNL